MCVMVKSIDQFVIKIDSGGVIEKRDQRVFRCFGGNLNLLRNVLPEDGVFSTNIKE